MVIPVTSPILRVRVHQRGRTGQQAVRVGESRPVLAQHRLLRVDSAPWADAPQSQCSGLRFL